MLPITRWKDPDTNEEVQSLLTRELGISPLISQILIARGITAPDEAKKFLFPSLEHLHQSWEENRSLSMGIMMRTASHLPQFW